MSNAAQVHGPMTPIRDSIEALGHAARSMGLTVADIYSRSRGHPTSSLQENRQMLYDKRWDKIEVKADPLSLESLIAWLEKQPADGTYDYDDCKGACLYGLYMTSHGVAWKESGACISYDVGPERAKFCSYVYLHVAARGPWTFGAALERARKALGK